MKVISITTILLLSLSSVALAGVIAPDANVEKLSSVFAFTEGPASDPKGNVYFTDQPNDKIYIWTTDGKLDNIFNRRRTLKRPVFRRRRGNAAWPVRICIIGLSQSAPTAKLRRAGR